MQPELHGFTKQTAGLKLLFCQMYNSCFITDSALVLNAYTLISCAKVKRKSQQLLDSIYAVQFWIVIFSDGMNRRAGFLTEFPDLVSSCLLLLFVFRF